MCKLSSGLLDSKFNHEDLKCLDGRCFSATAFGMFGRITEWLMSFRTLSFGGVCGFRPTVVLFSFGSLVWGKGLVGEADEMEDADDGSDFSSNAKLGL